MPKADLHTHSVYSDGTSSPREVVIAAQKTGVGIFALADPAYAEALAGLNTASVTWAGLAANLIPVTLGNILGGAGLGLAYWYIYLKKPKA